LFSGHEAGRRPGAGTDVPAEAGRFGLWTKADSLTHFGGFEVAGLR
jgi:hypothetical protein